MTREAQPSAMRRKAGAGRPPPEIGRLTAAKALRAAIAQAAQDVVGLVAVAGNVEEDRATLDPIAETVPDPSLLALIEGPGGRFGLVVLDAQVVAALIEVQTTGRVVPRPAEPRAPTRTDAIMCADFIDGLLDLLDQQVAEAELEIAPAVAGFRYAMILAEPRAIVMTLENVPFRRFSLTVNLGRGAKSGAMQLVLPFDPPGAGRRGGAEVAAFTEAMRAQVLDAEAQLTATLIRHQMSLAAITRLEVGAVLPVPRAALSQVTVAGLDGRVVAQGRLGQVNGHRAVRLGIGGAGGSGIPTTDASAAFDVASTGRAGQLPAPGAHGLGAIAAGPPADAGAAPGSAHGGFEAPAALGDIGGLSNLGDLGDLGDPGALAGLGDPGAPGDLPDDGPTPVLPADG